jgi:hypothetical protein
VLDRYAEVRFQRRSRADPDDAPVQRAADRLDRIGGPARGATNPVK